MPIFREMSGKIGKKPIYRRNIADKCKKIQKFPLTDYLREISCRYSPIHEISADISILGYYAINLYVVSFL